MATENKVNFVVDLSGNLSEKSRAYGSDIAAMSETGSRSMRTMSMSTNVANKAFSLLSRSLLAFAAGGQVLSATKKVFDYQQEFRKIGNQFNLTTEQTEKLKNQIYDKAQKYAVGFDELTKPAYDFLKRTNDFEATLDNLDNIALAMTGVGLSAEDAGNKVGILINKKWSSSDIKQFLNDTANLSKIGTGDIKEQVNRVVDVGNSTGWNSPKQLSELLKIERLGAAEVGDSGVAAAGLQEWYSALQDVKKQVILRNNGVEPLVKGTNKLRDPEDLFLEMGNAAKFNNKYISTIIGGNFSTLMQSFADKERQAKLKSGVENYNNNLIDEKAKSNSSTFNSETTRFSNYVKHKEAVAIERTQQSAPAVAKGLVQQGLSGALAAYFIELFRENKPVTATDKSTVTQSQVPVSGHISIHVSSDRGLSVKPVDVKSDGVGVSVDTGSTRGGY